jgi:hypothetical protein
MLGEVVEPEDAAIIVRVGFNGSFMFYIVPHLGKQSTLSWNTL